MNNENNKKIVHEIILKERIYNGVYGVGSIFEIAQILNIYENNMGELTITQKKCVATNPEKLLANMDIKYPFFFKDGEKEDLLELIEYIKNNPNYTYNESHYNKKGFDINNFSYYDFIVDGIEFEIPNNDEILEKIYLKCHSFDALQTFNLIDED